MKPGEVVGQGCGQGISLGTLQRGGEQQGDVLQQLRGGCRLTGLAQALLQAADRAWALAETPQADIEPGAVATHLTPGELEAVSVFRLRFRERALQDQLQGAQPAVGLTSSERITALHVDIAPEGLIGQQIPHQLAPTRVALLAQPRAERLWQQPQEPLRQAGGSQEIQV